MNEEIDFLSRLVDYHDHIATPGTPIGEDLRRGRLRVRRNRGLLVGGVALGLAGVVVAVSLATGRPSADDPQPVGPPTTKTTSRATPDHVGLSAPLVAPKSILGVRNLGFRVAPIAGLDPEGPEAGWSIDNEGQTLVLWWGEDIDDTVRITVGYQGSPDPDVPSGWERGKDVTIHGVPGRYYEEPDGLRGIGGTFGGLLAWEYAPESWAYVQTSSDRNDPGSKRLRSTLIEIAEAVAPGGDAVSLPFRLGRIPSSLPQPAETSEVGTRHGVNGVEGYANVGNVQIDVNGPSYSGNAAVCEPNSGEGAEPFTLRGHSGCLFGSGATDQPAAGTSFNRVDEISLLVGHTPRYIRPGFPDGQGAEHPVADMEKVLADLTVASMDDASTWFDLRTALHG